MYVCAGTNEMINLLDCVEITTTGLPRCKAGEHAATLAYIKAWATCSTLDSDFDDRKNILWLRGPPGCGKTKVVASFFDEFISLHCIGGNLFFEQDIKKDPALAMQTLAYHLALEFSSSHEALTHAIALAIDSDPELRLSRSLDEQFKALILEPLLAHGPDERPLVFLVDGIEWCGHGQDAETARKEQGVLMEALRVLVEGSTRFPPNVRLVISSRENEQVRELLGDCPRVEQLDMDAAVHPELVSQWDRWNRI